MPASNLFAAPLRDAAGRRVTIPDRVIFAAGLAGVDPAYLCSRQSSTTASRPLIMRFHFTGGTDQRFARWLQWNISLRSRQEFPTMWLIRPFICLASKKSLLLAVTTSLSLLTLASKAYTGDTSVAVAANFTEPAKEIAQLFQGSSGHKTILSFGATGQFYTQGAGVFNRYSSRGCVSR